MSLVWRIMPAMQRNEEVRTHRSSIYKRTTHILENTRDQGRSIHQQIENEKYTRSGEGKETDKSRHKRKHATEGHAPTGEQRGGGSSQDGERKQESLTTWME